MVLSDAEARLRELVAQAASAGEYDTVQRIADWARMLGNVTRVADRPEAGKPSPPSASFPRSRSDAGSTARSKAEEAVAGADGGRSRKAAPARRAKRTPTKGEYPMFYRRSEQLVKVGWSKKEREEYEHKAPLAAARALASAIEDRTGNGNLFTAEELFPLKDPREGGEFPGYQGYVVLAWFKAAGLIEQHGRSGYTMRDSRALGDAVRAAWSELPEKPI